MTLKFIQNIPSYIPAESIRVKNLYDAAVAVDTSLLVVRYVYASFAIVCSAINVASYAATLAYHTVTSVILIKIFRDFAKVQQQLSHGMTQTLHSLYFAATMTVLVAATILKPGTYSLKQMGAPTNKIDATTQFAPQETTSANPSANQQKRPDDNTKLPPLVVPKHTHPIGTEQSPEGSPTTPSINDQIPTSPPSQIDLSNSTTMEGWVALTTPTRSDSPTHVYPASKEGKYRGVFIHTAQLLKTEEMLKMQTHIKTSERDTAIKASTNNLYTTILQRVESDNPREQYKTYVLLLREAKQICVQKNIQTTHPYYQFVHKLALDRFTGLALYQYCHDLVVNASGALPENLSVETFFKELARRNEQIENLPIEQGIAKKDLYLQKMRGHFNIEFDPLIGSNVPYIYGKIQGGAREITILRHGVAVSQSEILGIFYRGLWGRQGNTIPDPTPDYVAFIEQAKAEGKKILHLIFENGECKVQGDESARVQMRLRLGECHTHFYPIALRMDGSFFAPKNYQPQPIETFKQKLLEQLLGTIETTGFSIPSKVSTDSNNNISLFLYECIQDVHTVYFEDKKSLESCNDHQAFILLTYARMTYQLCQTLDISILEAHCKDDIDRGGAFKAILTLDYLYRTNTLSSERLKELMVNIIAAPLIVKKQPILPDRALFISHVLEVLKRRINKQTPLDEPHCYTGVFKVV